MDSQPMTNEEVRQYFPDAWSALVESFEDDLRQSNIRPKDLGYDRFKLLLKHEYEGRIHITTTGVLCEEPKDPTDPYYWDPVDTLWAQEDTLTPETLKKLRGE